MTASRRTSISLAIAALLRSAKQLAALEAPGGRTAPMNALRCVLAVVGLLAALPASAKPKHILISDSLLANADPWNVKRGDRWVGMNRWSFGEYAVVASKTGWVHGGTHTNLFKTKTESYSGYKFSFVMTNGTADSAFVDAARQMVTQSNPGLKVGEDVHVGGTGQTVETDHFVASITINRDTTEMWDLFLGDSEVSDFFSGLVDSARHTAILIRGDRRIALRTVFSKKFSKKPSIVSQLGMAISHPAMGFEFIEDGRSLCAVEYLSSGVSGYYKNTVWMDRSADPRLRLVLAAAMTSVLELKVEAPEPPAEK